jgi:hypothetical protein
MVRLSFVPIDYPAATQVVRRQLYKYLVTRKDPDEVLAHLSGDVRQDLVFVLQFHSEHGIGKRLKYCPDYLYRVFFRHKGASLRWTGYALATPRESRAFTIPNMDSKMLSTVPLPSTSK